MENRAILEALYLQRDEALANAYQLEDGTHVFKSEDGVSVFDKEGIPVSTDIIDPDQIPDHHTTHEEWQAIIQQVTKHEKIDRDLIEYQEKLDTARDQLDSDELSQEEFESIRNDITTSMPMEVRRKLPEYDPKQEARLKSEFESTASQPVNLSPADMAIDPSLMPTPG